MTATRPSIRLLEAMPAGRRLSGLIPRYRLDEILSEASRPHALLGRLTTDDLKCLARGASAASLISVVEECADTEFLHWLLANDERVTVRQAVAVNPACPVSLVTQHVVTLAQSGNFDRAADAVINLCNRDAAVLEAALAEKDFRSVLATNLAWRYPVSHYLCSVLERTPAANWGDLLGTDEEASRIVLAALENTSPREYSVQLLDWAQTQTLYGDTHLQRRLRNLCSSRIAHEVPVGEELSALERLPWPELAEELLRSRKGHRICAAHLRNVAPSLDVYNSLMKIYVRGCFTMDRDSLSWVCTNATLDGVRRMRAFSGAVEDSAIDFIEESLEAGLQDEDRSLHDTLLSAVLAAFSQGTLPQRVRLASAANVMLHGKVWAAIPLPARDADYLSILAALAETSPRAAAWFAASWAAARKELPLAAQHIAAKLVGTGGLSLDACRALGPGFSGTTPVRALLALARDDESGHVRASAAEALAYARLWSEPHVNQSATHTRLRVAALRASMESGRITWPAGGPEHLPIVDSLTKEEVLELRRRHPAAFAALRELAEQSLATSLSGGGLAPWRLGVLPDMEINWARARLAALDGAMSFIEENTEGDNGAWSGAISLLEDWTGSLRQLVHAAKTL